MNLIDRDALKKECEKLYGCDWGFIRREFHYAEVIDNMPSAEPERKWIPFTKREMTPEEKEENPEWEYIMDCKLPDDGEEILVSNGKFVWSDTFVNDCDGCYLDGGTEFDGCAWMPLPEPWRGE